jgi:bifunctional pyridoxal-dependent enzyme with beta-cystathionase and maltose regulon repressor activities
MTAMMTVVESGRPSDRVFARSTRTTGRTRSCRAPYRFTFRSFPPDFRFDPEVLEDAFRKHPKALILCNPSNPCGKGLSRERN